MRSIFSKLIRDPVAEDAQATMNHIEIERDAKRDWRTRALKKAAARHGKPFKSAPAHLDREVLQGGEFVAVKGGQAKPETGPVIVTDNVRRMAK